MRLKEYTMPSLKKKISRKELLEAVRKNEEKIAKDPASRKLAEAFVKTLNHNALADTPTS